MISRDMPTSGTVIFPVRTLASASCSDDSAPRRVAHLAARLLATGAPADAASDADAEICCSSTRSRSSPKLRERRNERAVRRLGNQDPPAQLDEEPTIARLRRLAQCAFVADVAGEQHRDHIEVRGELVPQVVALLGRGRAHRVVHDERADDAHRQRDDRSGSTQSDRQQSQALPDREQQRRSEQAGHRGRRR